MHFHIDQSHIQTFILNQVTGSCRTIFLQLQKNIGVLFMKGIYQLRKENNTEHWRDAHADFRGKMPLIYKFMPQSLTALQNMICLLIKIFTIRSQRQSVVRCMKQRNRKFLFQLPDGDGVRLYRVPPAAGAYFRSIHSGWQ